MTTTTVPSKLPEDFVLNIENLDKFTNSTSATFTDRLGGVKRTLAGIDAEAVARAAANDDAATAQHNNIQSAADLVLAAAGYAPPVLYAAGINLTLKTQTVEYSGQAYAPLLSALPFTTSGTFETAKFRLIQGVAGVDLAAAGGAGMVGHNGTLNYAVGTIGAALNDTAINVKMFPWLAKFDGVTDDYPAIQAALNANVGTVIFPKGVAKVIGELNNNGKNIVGQGRNFTRILAGGAQRSVLKYTGGQAVVSGVFFDAGNVATHGVYAEGVNGSKLQACGVERSKLDLVVSAPIGNNNNFQIDGCLIRICGTTYTVGTATTTVNGPTTTIAGAVDLTTLGIRSNVDYVRVTGEPIARSIVAVTATTLTVQPPFSTAQAGATYKILQGSCIYIARHGDNSKIKITNTTLQDAPLAGIDDHALYGALSIGNVIETMEFGRLIGRQSNSTPTHEEVQSAEDFGNYYEVQRSAAVRLEYSRWTLIDPSLMAAGMNDLSINPGVNSYLTIRTQGVPLGEVFALLVNSTTTYAVSGGKYSFLQSVGATDMVLNLPALPTGYNEKSIRAIYGHQVNIVLTDVGGKQLTVKSPDATINGVAGATGIVLRGNNRQVSCFHDGNRWTLTPETQIQKATKLSSGGGVAAGATYTANLTGVDCTTASIQVSPYGGGDNTAADKYKVVFAITARSSTGCTIVLLNNGVSGQLLYADVTITT